MTKRILIADDEASVRLLVSNTLEDERFDIVEAVDGADALAKAEKLCPDLLILDFMMPNLNGVEVCRRVKADPLLAHTKIIMLTARTQNTDTEQAMQAGADHYLQKPFSPLELMNLVEEVLNA